MPSDADDHFGLHSGFKRSKLQSRLGDMGSEEKPLGGVPCQVCRDFSSITTWWGGGCHMSAVLRASQAFV